MRKSIKHTCERRSIFIKQMFRIRFDSSLYVDTFLIFEEIDYTFDGFEDIHFYVKQFVRLTEWESWLLLSIIRSVSTIAKNHENLFEIFEYFLSISMEISNLPFSLPFVAE